MRYYCIAGEASGDLHGSNLIKAIKQKDVHANFRCWGGDLMEAEGVTLVKHYRSLAFMGFFEVVKNLRTILANISFCKADIASFKPDVIILIDYPGFNLKIAEWAKKQGYKVVYYIAPQVWAWKSQRVKLMKQCIDAMICILPFEQKYFKEKWNWDVFYVGHPLIEAIESAQKTNHLSLQFNKDVVAILPGSRKQEIKSKLPIMLSVAKYFPNHQFVVAKAPALPDAFYEDAIAGYENVSAVKNQTYTLLKMSKAAIVTSGTATLETALFNVPEVIGYKTGKLTYEIAKRIIKIKYICLVNLIMDKPVVKELIQDDLNEANLISELKLLLFDEAYRKQMLEDYSLLRQRLNTQQSASENAANIIMRLLSS